jgi:hypothetical protein
MQTLPQNLQNESNNQNVEFVVLNYDSEDGLSDWIQSTFKSELASGRLVHVHHTPAPNFKMAHAKNMAHRAGTGEILCNLDADNIIPKDFSSWLLDRFDGNQRLAVSPRRLTLMGFFRERWINKILGLPRPADGICGRIAISKDNFLKIGGYDEKFSAWGSDDIDFLLRARDLGVSVKRIPPTFWGGVLKHGNEERLANLSAEDKKKSVERLRESSFSQLILRIKQLSDRTRGPANLDGKFGCGAISTNFSQTTYNLEPVDMAAAREK